MKNKVSLLLSAAILLSSAASVQAQKLTVEQYIAKYQDLAISAMKEYKIPASIKMGQAILESTSGNSPLALKSNNHFGIKCKTEWTGETVLHDDDAKNECFRKYSSVSDSYSDHSLFLAQRDYYKELFTLDITDYTAWAYGLKKAGYATSPTYAQQLIKIIEDNKLYQLDDMALGTVAQTPAESATPATEELDPKDLYSQPKVLEGDFALYKKDVMNIYKNNRAKFVIATAGDTFQTIGNKVGKSVSKLLKYNDFLFEPKAIEEGTIVYISSKKRRASNGHNHHLVNKGETLHSVSQKFGIKIDKLAARNLYTRNYTIKAGQKMLLR